MGESFARERIRVIRVGFERLVEQIPCGIVAVALLLRRLRVGLPHRGPSRAWPDRWRPGCLSGRFCRFRLDQFEAQGRGCFRNGRCAQISLKKSENELARKSRICAEGGVEDAGWPRGSMTLVAGADR